MIWWALSKNRRRDVVRDALVYQLQQRLCAMGREAFISSFQQTRATPGLPENSAWAGVHVKDMTLDAKQPADNFEGHGVVIEDITSECGDPMDIDDLQ